MRLIDADEAIINFGFEWDDISPTRDEFVEFIKKQPTIEAEPVKRAEWIEDGYRGLPCVCSYCGEEAHYTSKFKETFGYDWEENLKPTGFEEIREYIKTDYCPACGAKMYGDGKEGSDNG